MTATNQSTERRHKIMEHHTMQQALPQITLCDSKYRCRKNSF